MSVWADLKKKPSNVSNKWWAVLIITEIIRWLVIVTPIYLSVWRYATLKGYTVFINGHDVHTQFWGMVTLFVILGTLLLYVPMKILAIAYRFSHGMFEQMKW